MEQTYFIFLHMNLFPKGLLFSGYINSQGVNRFLAANIKNVFLYFIFFSSSYSNMMWTFEDQIMSGNRAKYFLPLFTLIFKSSCYSNFINYLQ